MTIPEVHAMSFASRLFLETDCSRENDVTHYFDTIGVLSGGLILFANILPSGRCNKAKVIKTLDRPFSLILTFR